MTFYWAAADVKGLYATFVFKLNNKEITAPPKKAFTWSKNTKNENNEWYSLIFKKDNKMTSIVLDLKHKIRLTSLYVYIAYLVISSLNLKVSEIFLINVGENTSSEWRPSNVLLLGGIERDQWYKMG